MDHFYAIIFLTVRVHLADFLFLVEKDLLSGNVMACGQKLGKKYFFFCKRKLRNEAFVILKITFRGNFRFCSLCIQ